MSGCNCTAQSTGLAGEQFDEDSFAIISQGSASGQLHFARIPCGQIARYFYVNNKYFSVSSHNRDVGDNHFISIHRKC